MQNDDPFASFKASSPETAGEVKPDKKEKKRGRKAKAEHKAKPVVAVTLGNGSVMVPLNVLASIRQLSDDEVKFTIAMANGIAELSKPAQRHVVTALAKIFS